jgi:hypothetical protein
MNSRRASPVFYIVVLVTLAFFGFIGVVLFKPDLIGGVLGHETRGHISEHFRGYHHRVHDLTFSFLMGTAVVGMLAQLRRPSQNVAGQLMALVPWVALGLAFVLSTTMLRFAPAPVFAALTLLATILHPARRHLFSSFNISRANRVMLALVILAAVPLVAFASTNIGLQRSVMNDHAALGHYGFMAAFSFTVIGVGLLASQQPEGWRLTAWVAGILPVLLGLTSLVYPDVDSRLGVFWAVAAIAWGVVFIAVAERTKRFEHAHLMSEAG